jgi:hypothetical protein
MIRLTTAVTILTIPYALALPSIRVNRDVTNTSKAGLAWPNGDGVDIGQYETTGEVSWSVQFVLNPRMVYLSKYETQGIIPGLPTR